ncbi:MAG: tetratricopeptide repeat protein, partial [Patescibacteria group bacterium]
MQENVAVQLPFCEAIFVLVYRWRTGIISEQYMNNQQVDAGNEQLVAEISNKIWKKYRAWVAGILITFVVAACVFVFRWEQNRRMEEKATTLYLKGGNKSEVWKEISEKYPQSSKGAEVLLNLASEAWHQHRYDEAIGYYQRFLTQYKKHPVTPAVDLAIAACFEASGKALDAREAYFKITQLQKHPFFGAASIGLARIYK